MLKIPDVDVKAICIVAITSIEATLVSLTIDIVDGEVVARAIGRAVHRIIVYVGSGILVYIIVSHVVRAVGGVIGKLVVVADPIERN